MDMLTLNTRAAAGVAMGEGEGGVMGDSEAGVVGAGVPDGVLVGDGVRVCVGPTAECVAKADVCVAEGVAAITPLFEDEAEGDALPDKETEAADVPLNPLVTLPLGDGVT